MSVVSISMPEALLDRISEFAEEHEYSGRSEVVREGARMLLEEFDGGARDGGPYVGTVIVVFECRHSTVQQHLAEIRHDNGSAVTATTHTHLGNRYCMELFVLEGSPEALAEFVNSVRVVSDVRAVDYSLTSLGEEHHNPPPRS
nr:CopG family ribbon-helix-helix protein [Haloferax sp. ATCC BAA-644]